MEKTALEILQSDLGQQLLSVLSTSNGKFFIWLEECRSEIESKGLEDKTVTEWVLDGDDKVLSWTIIL